MSAAMKVTLRPHTGSTCVAARTHTAPPAHISRSKLGRSCSEIPYGKLHLNLVDGQDLKKGEIESLRLHCCVAVALSALLIFHQMMLFECVIVSERSLDVIFTSELMIFF